MLKDRLVITEEKYNKLKKEASNLYFELITDKKVDNVDLVCYNKKYKQLLEDIKDIEIEISLIKELLKDHE